MSDTTYIEWTHWPGTIGSTWNPWRGCHKVSSGCKNCYMFRDQVRYGHDPNIIVRSKTTFNDPMTWKEPHTIFACSWSDWFIEEADKWRDEAWDIVRLTKQHDYLILTKRPERIANCLPVDWADFGNVWLGVSVENQVEADRRIPIFPINFLSCEPLLGPIAISKYLSGIDWVIAGGESGPNFRPMQVEWVRLLQVQCQVAGVPFFCKQDAGLKPGRKGRLPDDLWNRKEFPNVELIAA